MDTILLIISGIAAGIIGGMGMGGGTLLIPLLNIFFGIKQHTAQAVNLVVFIPMSIAALIIHIKKKLVDYKKALLIILPSSVTAVGGAFAAKNIDSGSLQKFFGGFLILIAVFQVVVYIIEKKQNKLNNNTK